MAVTLISSPIGHKLSNTIYDAAIEASGDYALVRHSTTVIDGSWVYIESNFDRYNGFKYAVVITPTSFRIRNSVGDDYIQFIQEADITFQISELDHAWQSVHLPIVYELESNLFPTNVPEEEDTHKTIESFANSNGYTQINSPIDFSSPEVLEYVELIGDGPLAGKYQIISVVDSNSIVIDLAYNASDDFSGYYVVKYYSNYFVEVYVYSGLESNHRWDTEKPSRLAATLRLIPDENNRVRFSISEIVKGDINTRNNLTLDTLPNNIDFYAQFHIDWMERYDEAADGEIVIFDGTLVHDTFVGSAVNSMMPFKSLNESFMSDYLGAPDNVGRWLTLFDNPTAIVGYFFDLSFLLNYQDIDVNITIFKSAEGIVTSTETILIENPGLGVIRVPIIPESGYDKYCLMVSTVPDAEGILLSDFANIGAGISWATGAAPSITIGPSQSAKILGNVFSFVTGREYIITANFDYDITGIAGSLRLGIYDSSNVLLESELKLNSTGSGSSFVTLAHTATSESSKIGFHTARGAISGEQSFTITSLSVTLAAYDVTETICVNIIDDCGDTFINDDLRITEDDLFRQIE